MINLSEDSLAWIEAVKILKNDMTEDRLFELMDFDGIPEPEQEEIVKVLRSLAQSFRLPYSGRCDHVYLPSGPFLPQMKPCLQV